MKTTVKFFVILFALAMQVCSVYADNKDNKGTPVTVKSTRDTPTVSGNAGPRRARAQVTTLDIDIYLDLTTRCLNFCDPEGRNITYNTESTHSPSPATVKPTKANSVWRNN